MCGGVTVVVVSVVVVSVVVLINVVEAFTTFCISSVHVLS